MKKRNKDIISTEEFPVPEGSPKLGKSKYPFKDMKVSDSFAVDERKRFSVATLAKKFGDSQEPVWRFMIARPFMGQPGQFRCWRTK